MFPQGRINLLASLYLVINMKHLKRNTWVPSTFLMGRQLLLTSSQSELYDVNFATSFRWSNQAGSRSVCLVPDPY